MSVKLTPTEIAERTARGARLRSLRQSLNLSRDAFSDKFGISLYTLTNWESNRSKGLKEDKVYEVIKLFESAGLYCAPEWLMHGIGNPPTFIDPSKYVVPSEKITEKPKANEKNHIRFVAEVLRVTNKYYPTCMDMKIIDDTMMPFYCLGDHVVGVKLPEKDISQAIGKDCIVLTESREQLVRQVKSGDSEDRFTLVCANTNTTNAKPFLYEVKLLMAAPIVLIKKFESNK